MRQARSSRSRSSNSCIPPRFLRPDQFLPARRAPQPFGVTFPRYARESNAKTGIGSRGVARWPRRGVWFAQRVVRRGTACTKSVSCVAAARIRTACLASLRRVYEELVVCRGCACTKGAPSRHCQGPSAEIGIVTRVSGGALAENIAQRGEALGNNAPPHPAAALFADDQTNIRKGFGVMADRGLAFCEWPFEIARTDFFVSSNKAQQSQPDRVGERGEKPSRLRRVGFVHRRGDD